MKTPWLSRDSKLGIGLVLLLVVVTALAAAQEQKEQEYPVLSTLSSAPNGALALKLWVQQLNYAVDEQALAEFVPPENTSILFMLEPLFPTEGELQVVDAWVEEGGTYERLLPGAALVPRHDISQRVLAEMCGASTKA